MRVLPCSTKSCVHTGVQEKFVNSLLIITVTSVLVYTVAFSRIFATDIGGIMKSVDTPRRTVSILDAVSGDVDTRQPRQALGFSDAVDWPSQEPCCFLNQSIFAPNAGNQTNATHLKYLLAMYDCNIPEDTPCSGSHVHHNRSTNLNSSASSHDYVRALRSVVDVQTRRTGPQRVAVLVSGVLRRFLPKRIVQGIVQPQQANGVDVDMYIHIVNVDVSTYVGKIKSYEYEPPIDTILPNITAYRAYVMQLFEGAGARVVKFNIDDQQEHLLPWPLHDSGQMNLIRRRMHEYPASKNKSNSEIGRNVLRRYATVEKQWADAQSFEAASGFKYNWVLWTREDTAWLLPLQLNWRTFPTGFHVNGVVYTRDCLTWANVSDKVLLMDREAASTLLVHLYRDFYNYTGTELESVNAETYINKVLKLHGIMHVIPGTNVLAASDARYERWKDNGPYFCYRKKYMCHDYKFGAAFANVKKKRCNKS
eukprot:m.1395877 g.1395877  ORF g.1395877 m.1395877 type:complete len:479 (-) comp24994_c1_seq40:2591-4027(-)